MIDPLTSLLHKNGIPMTLIVRRNTQATRITLRLHNSLDAIILTAPPRLQKKRLESILLEHLDWLRQAVTARPPLLPLQPGSVLPWLGQPRVLQQAPAAQRGISVTDTEILVTGEPAFFARRLQDWIRAQARQTLSQEAVALAARLGRTPGKIRIGDQRSRWGSCTSRGDLAFSWRLMLCPPEVRHYIVAHEVAHLREMNHSPAFWALVEQLCPQAKSYRNWLRQHGPALLRIGVREAHDECQSA